MALNYPENNLIRNEKKEILVCMTASLVIVGSTILTSFNGIIRSFVTLPYKIDTLLVYSLFLLLIILSASTIIVRISPIILLILAFLLFNYFIAFMINGYYYDYYLKFGSDFILRSAPWLLVAYSVRDLGIFKKILYVSSLIVFVGFVLNFFVLGTTGVDEKAYSQQYAYLLLPVCIIVGDKIFEKVSIFNILVFLLSTLIMVSMGARGPIFCLLIYLALKTLLMFKSKPKIAFSLCTITTLIITIVYTFFNELLSSLLFVFGQLNLSTRTLTKIMEGNFFEDQARNRLVVQSLEAIKENPFFGVGIGNDRIILANKMGSNEIIGWYPHNIVIEFILQFGIIVGSISILLLLIIILTTILKNKDKVAVDVICIFIALGLFPLLVSGSYITSPFFFALLGICLFQFKEIINNQIKAKEIGI